MLCLRFCFAISFLYLILFFTCVAPKEENSKDDFLAFTVATEETDGYKRFIRSAQVNNIPLKVLGMGKKWEGGDMKGLGGGYKIILLKEALEPFKNDNKKVVLFTDAYDVVITGSAIDIIHRFKNMNAGIVFSTEVNCWPEVTLADEYPATESKYKYLNSGGFIGYASDIYGFISSKELESPRSDDQLFYSKLFLDKSVREKYQVKLDYKAKIFQNLYDAYDDVELRFDNSLSYIENTKYGSVPLIIHGNGPAKEELNSLSNYVPKVWNNAEGCVACVEDRFTLPENESDYPKVLMGIFITQPTPFIEEFFRRIHALQYPKDKLHLFIYNSLSYHEGIVKQFIESYGKEYSSFKQIKPSDGIGESDGRNHAIKLLEKRNCDYFLNVDSIAHFDNPKAIQLLIESNKSIIAPLFVRPYKAWSNFWGSLTKDGYYYRSFDYMNIVNYERKGLWNVPYISSVYLIKSSLIKDHKPKFHHENLDPDMSFCKTYRDKGIFMYVDNTVEYGHLIEPDNFDLSRVNPDLYEIFNNKYDWEQRYIHAYYHDNLNPNKTLIKEPCPDVYWIPVTTERFCKELIEIMENFGQWSDGSNQDNRLLGGYENVPTRDIHMNQVGLEPAWLEFLRRYVRPIQEHLFIGYYHDPPRSLMNFVVRYKPDEQPNLRPHHDQSTYTINMALNKPHIDYKGGGCRFIRYNCSVVDTKVGWIMMHPGRLTHYHEGLEVTSGTRYIMISFVDP